jgi:hypothetical protein
MDLQQLKELISYARKLGVQSLEFEGLRVNFKDEVVVTPKRKRQRVPMEGSVSAATVAIPAPPQLPTLDEINEYIYGTTEEAS